VVAYFQNAVVHSHGGRFTRKNDPFNYWFAMTLLALAVMAIAICAVAFSIEAFSGS